MDLETRLQAVLGDAYRIDREIGGGGMSRLFLATEVSLHRQVVIKVLPPELTSEVSAARFAKEIELAAHLQHPHILPLLTAGARDSLLYYVTPFVSGESLRHRLTRDGKLPVADAVQILREVADALSYAHAQGVIHRDIKPANVLLSGGHAVLIDFGVARALAQSRPAADRLTATGLALGTPGYMSPEQAAGEGDIDARADVYALAVVGYELLSGHAPFAGSTAQAVIASQFTSTPRPLREARADTPPAVARAISLALARNPNERLATAADFRDAITETVRGSTKRTGAPPAALTIGLLLAAIVGVAVWMHERRISSSETKSPMLAVRPFRNLAAPADQYFADGITEEMTTRLSEISGMRVIGRASSNQYQDARKSVQQIGTELGAQYVLEGTVRTDRGEGKSGHARVAPRLVRTSDGTNVWADAYTVDLAPGAIFAAQTTIAEQVARALHVALLGSERAAVATTPTSNAEAYDLYLRAGEYLRRGIGQNWELQRTAAKLYERATQLDPHFALAFAGLADANLRMYRSGYDLTVKALPPGERLMRVRRAAERALELDSSLADVHRILVGFHRSMEDSAAAARESEVWWRAAPNDPRAILARALRQAALGQSDDASRSIDLAMKLDPRSAAVAEGAVMLYARGGQYREAVRYAERQIELAPDDPQGYAAKAWYFLLDGDSASARATLTAGASNVGWGSVVVSLSRNSWWANTLRILPDVGERAQGLSVDAFLSDTLDYLTAKTQANYSDPNHARAYWDSIRTRSIASIRTDTSLRENIANYIGLAAAYAALGQHTQAREIVADLDRRAQMSQGNHGLVAGVLVALGETRGAMDHLSIALQDRTVYSPALLRFDPMWKPLRGDARFQMLLHARR